jgi:hypothetical protein
MTAYPLTLADITSWYRSKQHALAGMDVSLVGIRERTEYTPAARADFDGVDAMGEICGWVSGEFDFAIVRVSDGAQVFWRHADVAAVDDLESAFTDFLGSMLNPQTTEPAVPEQSRADGEP